MAQLLTSVTGDAGINGVGLLVNTQLGWYFRPQPVADVGIDAQVETVVDGTSTGRLLGLQIKSGPSMFSEPAPDGDGWVYRERTQTHRHYWLRYQLPVLLVLYQIETHTAYWQVVTDETTVVTGSGFRIFVPSTQRLDATASETLVALARRRPFDAFGERLDSLPPGCAARLTLLQDKSPTLAQHLAEQLVEGRDEPGNALAKITATSGGSQWPWLVWAALADFANEYGLVALAADYFLRAADLGPGADLAGRFVAYAGLLHVSSDAARARSLLARASSSAGGRSLATVGLAYLDHGECPGPIPDPQFTGEDAARAAEDPTILRFLAEQRMVVGDVDGAIQLHEKALALAPDAPGQQVALAEALLRRPRPQGGGSQLDGYRKAVVLAAAARSAQRRWRADSTKAAEVLLHALAMAGDERSAVRVAVRAPDGEATEAEAASPALAFYAARLSYEVGDLAAGDRLAEVVTASGRREWITQCAAVRAQAANASMEEQVLRWREVLAAGDGQPHRLVALQNLAQLGCWPLPRLDAMRDAGQLAEGVYEMLHAQALAASGHVDTGLSLLRGAHGKSLLVAEAYARQLAATGHIDECVRVCDQSSLRFGDSRLSLYALDVLTRAERMDEVISRATALLGRTDLPFNLRHLIRGNLIDVFTGQRDWTSCERLGHDGLSEVRRLRGELRDARADPLVFPASAAADLTRYEQDCAWTIIISQYNQGMADRAYETLESLRPRPGTAPQMQAWCDLHRLHGWTQFAAEEALALAAQDDTPAEVVGRLLFSLVQVCQPEHHTTLEAQDGGPGVDVTGNGLAVPVSENFHLRLTRAWTSFLETHHPGGAERLNGDGDGDGEQLRARLNELLAPSMVRHQQAREAIHAGQVPLGALGLAMGQPYLLTLVHQSAGLVPAVEPTDDALDVELQVAKTALGNTISIETSALYVTAVLAQLWPAVRDAFLTILIAKPTVLDIQHSQLAARNTANVAGSFQLSPETPQLRIAESSDRGKRLHLEQTATVHHAAQECQLIDVEPSEPRPSLPEPSTAAWVAPVFVAEQNNVPLFSDDVVLRAWARTKGVPAFGTLALIEALLDIGQILPDSVGTIVAKLFRGNVVDLPTSWPMVIESVETNGAPAPHALLNLSRPALWQGLASEEIGPYVVELIRLACDNPASLDELVTATAHGLTAAMEPAEQVLGILGAVTLAHMWGADAFAGAPVVVRAIQRVGVRLGIDPLPAIQQTFVGTLTDPTGPFRQSPDTARQALDDAMTATPNAY